MTPLYIEREEIRLLTKKEIISIVVNADLVIEIVDARVPEILRSRFLENTAIANSKRLILLLNKKDLVPREVVEKWLRYYRSKNIETYATSIIHGDLGDFGKVLGSLREGKTYAAVFGAPKVGKSTLINLLKKKSSAPTSRYPGTPGYTRFTQIYKINPNLYIIDTPGVLFIEKDPLERIIRTKAPEKLKNPVKIAVEIIKRVQKLDPSFLDEGLGIRCPEDPIEILRKYAIYRGWFYEKDQEPIIEEAARDIIRRYLDGRIRYYTTPVQE
ncbi:MAG: GTPase [Sulfolobales archaeon]